MKYDDLCEMDIGGLLNSIMGTGNKSQCCAKIEKPVQPDDDIGKFGNEKDIHIKVTPEGGIEIDSKDMAIKISSDVFEAIKSFVKKGE